MCAVVSAVKFFREVFSFGTIAKPIVAISKLLIIIREYSQFNTLNKH